MVNHFSYTYISHSCIVRAALLGVTTPLGLALLLPCQENSWPLDGSIKISSYVDNYFTHSLHTGLNL